MQAQALLGLLYMEGNGTPKSQPQALHWYTKAAAVGDALGELMLGNMYVVVVIDVVIDDSSTSFFADLRTLVGMRRPSF